MRLVSSFAFVALLLWPATACQGGEGDGLGELCHCSYAVDADVLVIADATQEESCNPIAQAGCEPGEKCGQLVESAEPNISHITCLPEGTVQNGGTCSSGRVGAATGFDNCVGGYHCLDGRCVEICDVDALDACTSSQEPGLACTKFDDLFFDRIGVCTPVPTP